MADAGRDNNRNTTLLVQSSSVATTTLNLTATPIASVNPLNVAIVDGSGVQVTSFGGGTQYTDAGTAPANPIGNAIEWSEGGTWRTVSTAKPLPVTATLTSTTITGTVAVSQSTSPWVVSNGGTFAVQATLAAETTKVIGTVNIAASQTIAVTNTGTFAVQSTPITQADTFMLGGVNIKEINAVTPLMGNGVTGTGSQRVTIASDNTPFPVKLDQTTPGTTNAISIAQIGGTTILNGGVAGSQAIGGTVATNVAINSNPVNLGVQAVSSENTAVTTARQVQLVADLVGKLIVLPYANPENFVSGAITSAMTGTTTTSLIAAPAAGLRNYITQITVSNSHATVGTDVIIQDGSGGTTLYTIPAAAVYGGAVVVFPTPLRQPTTATAIFCANVTTGASTKVSASGYKGA